MTTPDTTPEAVAPVDDEFRAAVNALHDAAYTHGESGARFGPVVSECNAATMDVFHLYIALAADRDHWRQRAERAEAALAARTAAEYPAAFAADAAARAKLAADRAAIPMTERDRREASGEGDVWTPWREGGGDL